MGKVHPDALQTIVNMAVEYKNPQNFTKAEELYMLALDGYENSLGKDHGDTKDCARNFAILYVDCLGSKEKL